MKARGTVQQSYVPVREVGPDYLALYAPETREKRVLCGVIEVSGINYRLKSEAEQRLLNDVFRVLLASLSYPIQIVMRIQPFDTPRYLAHFDGHSGCLAQDYKAFVQDKAMMLMQRRFYVIVPSGQTVPEEGGITLFGRLSEVSQQEAHERLTLRLSTLSAQLVAMGLTVRRLKKAELIGLEYSMLSPKRAHAFPLQEAWIEHLDHPLVKPLHQPTPLPTQARRALKKKTRQEKQKNDVLLWPHVADLLAPSRVTLTPSMLYIEDEWVQVLDVFALPRRVGPGWLNSLASLDIPIDISFFYIPLSTERSMRRLGRKRFEAATTNQMNSERGTFQPKTNVVQLDLEDLMSRIAGGQERLLEWSMRLVVRGTTKKETESRAASLRGRLSSMLLGCRPCIFEQDKAFRSCLPHARNELGPAHPMASHEASSTFPFFSPSFLHERGVLEGVTLGGNEPVILDWWDPSLRNANRLIVAPSGAGKSFKAKVDTIRSQLWYGKPRANAPLPYQTLVVDIEREYKRLTDEYQGQWIRLAPGTKDYLNPFDLPQAFGNEDVLAEKVAHLLSLLEIMIADNGRLSNSEKGVLDQALFACYQRCGITREKATHRLSPPRLFDLYTYLREDMPHLAQRLHRFVHGSLSGLFGGQTNISLTSKPVICFDIHDVPKELRPTSLFLISSAVWNLSFGSRIPRQFIVDELLTLYQYEGGKHFLESLFQRARKHYLSIVGITQYPKILLDSTIPTNCATNVIMAQEVASLPMIRDIFHLSETEVQMVRSFGKGDALLLTNEKRFALHVEASPSEYTLCTSDPADLAHRASMEAEHV